MKILDFLKAKPPEEVKATKPPLTTASSDKPRRESIEHIIEDPNWGFTPIERRIFSNESLQNAAAIYSAQQMRRIADDIEAIRKHVTRLQLVREKEPDDGIGLVS